MAAVPCAHFLHYAPVLSPAQTYITQRDLITLERHDLLLFGGAVWCQSEVVTRHEQTCFGTTLTFQQGNQIQGNRGWCRAIPWDLHKRLSDVQASLKPRACRELEQ